MRSIPISSDDPNSVKLLLVEDDQDMTELLRRFFKENPDYASSVSSAATLVEAVEAIERHSFDAVLLDLGLPDSDGLRTAKAVVEAAPAPTAVVILSGQRDVQLAAQSLAIGVQDYVLKEEITLALVTRVVRYAVTRAQMTEELAAARRGEERERELRRLERMATDSPRLSVSAAMLGAGSLEDRMGARYEEEIVTEYARILAVALEEQAFRGVSQVSRDLRSLASVLGFFGAGPRDIVELHSRCLRQQLTVLDHARAAPAVEEGRVLVLQLMGRLVTYYRERSIGGTRQSNPGGAHAPREGTPSAEKKESS